MKGKLYNNLIPKNNKFLQSIFFRGHKNECDFINHNKISSMKEVKLFSADAFYSWNYDSGKSKGYKTHIIN